MEKIQMTTPLVDRPAGENKRRRPPYRGGRRGGGKGGDAPKT